MVLLLLVVGALILTTVFSAVVKTRMINVPSALLLALAVVLGLNFWGDLWPQMKGLVDTHRFDDKLTLAASNAAGGSGFGVNEPFLAYVSNVVPPHARVFIECGQHEATCGSEEDWFGYRLLPRVFVARPSQAQWAIFYNADAVTEPFARGWKIDEYATNFSVARAPR